MEREDRLFDACERTDKQPSSHGERTFYFWNRSAWEAAAEVRSLLEKTFAQYPTDRRRDVRRRFRSKRDDEHEGALLELLVFAMLNPSNVKVNADTPDFECGTGRKVYLVEAKAFGQYTSADRLEQQVLDTIEEKLKSPHFFLDIGVRGELESTPPHHTYIGPIEKLLETPPEGWDSLAAQAEINLDCYAERTCRIGVSLLPKERDAPEHPLIGVQWSGSTALLPLEVQWENRLFGELEKKAKKLKYRSEPSYLAVSVPCYPQVPTSSIATRVLYGLSTERKESASNSFWFKAGNSRNKHVQGVVVCGKLLPHALDHREMVCRLYMAPDAGDPPEPLSQLPRARFDGKRVHFTKGETLGKLVRDGLGGSG